MYKYIAFNSLILITVLIVRLYGPTELTLNFLHFICIISILSTIFNILFRMKIPSLYGWFSLSYVALFLVYPAVFPFLSNSLPVSDETYFKYCFLAISGIHIFTIGYEIASSKLKPEWEKIYSTSNKRITNIILILLSINIASLIFIIIDAGSISVILSQTRNEMESRIGILSLIGVYMVGIGALLYPIMGAYIRKAPHRIFFWIPIIIAIEVLLFLAFRVRTFPVLHVLGLLLGWWFVAPRLYIDTVKQPLLLKPKPSFLQILLIGSLLIALAISMFSLRILRGEWESTGSITAAMGNITISNSINYAFHGSGELGYSTVVFKAIDVIPSQYDYLYGQSYYRLLFVPIPRSFWQDKPLNTQRIMAQRINPDALEIQTTPVGIVGDLYVNFGQVGVIGMLIFGYLFGKMDGRVTLADALLATISAAMIFHLARGAFTNPIIELSLYFYISKLVSEYLTRNNDHHIGAQLKK